MGKATYHRVRQGECIKSIAAAYGVKNPDDIFGHDENRALKDKRKTPHVLMPGDIVFVPEVTETPLSYSSGGSQNYKATIAKVPLKLKLTGKDLAGKSYKLHVGKKVFEGTLSEGGSIQHDISALATDAHLEIDLGGSAVGSKVYMPIKIGHLDPIDEITGVQGRLTNLGFYAPISGELDELTRASLAKFQRAVGLAPTGELTDETRDKLAHAQTHGVGAKK